jgi:hypothetical protein
LEILLPKHKFWWEDLRKELIGFLGIMETPSEKSLALAELLYEKMGLSKNDLYQDLASSAKE